MMRRISRISLWMFGIPSVLLLVLYVVLLVTPVPLPFASEGVRSLVMSTLGPTSRLELGDMALALERGSVPVMRFSPVVYTDTKSGAKVSMEALEVGFSPLRALVGQPGASITIVGARLQMNQDLLGPRLTSFELVPDPDGGPDLVRVQEGEDAFPPVNISTRGLNVSGAIPESLGSSGLRSDNEWLIYNFEAMEKGLSDLVKQAQEGRFSRFVLRKATIDMNDAVYGVFRQFTDVSLDVTPSRDNQRIEGEFAASLAGRKMTGTIARIKDADGGARVLTTMSNIDFVALAAFVEDSSSPVGLLGQGAVSMDFFFTETGAIRNGLFRFDLSGTDLRYQRTLYPVLTSIVEVEWEPQDGDFTMRESDIRVGENTARISGVFRMGMDDTFGPVIGMSVTARDVMVHPTDMGPPSTPIDQLTFTGWSAPLYGATGVDQLVIDKADGKVALSGRLDMVHEGMGVDLAIAGEGVSADDIKRFWPSLFAPDARKWVIDSVSSGAITKANMRFRFPVGSMAAEGEPPKPIPPGALYIDLTGQGITVLPMAGMDPLLLEGETRFTMRDSEMILNNLAGATLQTASGPIAIRNAAMVMGSEGAAGQTVLEISGDVTAGLQALMAFAEKQQPDALQALKSESLPIDPKAIEGNVNVAMVATIGLAEGTDPKIDFAINGRASGIGSSKPIQGFSLNGGELAFTASQRGYEVRGSAALQGIKANFDVGGSLDGVPDIAITSTINAADLAKLGFDASRFLSGSVKLTAAPTMDGTLKVALDLKEAGLTVKELGISKNRGQAGTLDAVIRQQGDAIDIRDVALSFGDVSVKGAVALDAKAGALRKAEFSQIAMSPGDNASLTLTPINSGYAVKIAGAQLDLKPILGRFFSLSGAGGSPGGASQAPLTEDAIQLDVKLDRALGFYKTTAFNVDVGLALKGSDLQRVNLQAQLGSGRSISVTTNATSGGKVMSVALNDFGALLRLIGVYPRVEGGTGTLVMRTDTAGKYDIGEFKLESFALVDEDKVTELLDGAGRRANTSGRMNFDTAQVSFVRRADRVEVQKALLGGDTIGGTASGVIYTNRGEYDLTGTIVPLFGINSALANMPILGPLLTGRDGAGMFGITFAVRGPLDKPDFRMNPASLLAPGVFREMFSYRSRDRSRAAN